MTNQTIALATARGTFRVAVDGDAEAPALVLGNSLGTTLEMWEPQVPAFSQSFRVIRYDTRGHGGSAVTSGPYSFEELGLDVLAVLDALHLDKASFCGISMGGTPACGWACMPATACRRSLCATVPPASVRWARGWSVPPWCAVRGLHEHAFAAIPTRHPHGGSPQTLHSSSLPW